MSMCLEVKSEYTEVSYGVAERELKNVKIAASKYLPRTIHTQSSIILTDVTNHLQEEGAES